MRYEWDPGKAAANLAKHGVAFEEIETFDWDTALSFEDMKMDYGETRQISFGLIRGNLHVVVHTDRGGMCRVIGLRKANSRERAFYETET